MATKKTIRTISLTGLPRDSNQVKHLTDDFADILEVSTRPATGVTLAGTRGSTGKELSFEYKADDIAELILEDQLAVYCSMDRLENDFFPQAKTRSGGKSSLRLPTHFQPPGWQSRGEGGLRIESFQLLNVKNLAAKAGGKLGAKAIAHLLENKLMGEESLYRLSKNPASENTMDLLPVTTGEISTTQPILVFIHGTFSSTYGSYEQLWKDPRNELWPTLEQHYKEQIYCLEHRTLSRSPIDNAVTLMEKLPKSCTVHLVSHSRGGIVGELLCRGMFVNGREPFTRDEIDAFHRKDSPRIKDFLDDLHAEYDSHRAQLTKLNKLLVDKKPRIEKFVRVACPARGTTLVSGKLDIYCSRLLNLIGLIPALRASPVYQFVKALLLAIIKERTEPEELPGLEAQMPGSPLLSLLNNTGEQVAASLLVIKGDAEPTSIAKKIAMLLADRFFATDHDLVVNTPSMDGGCRRASAIPVLFDKGKEVLHTHYFINDRTRRGLVAGLTSTEQPPPDFNLEFPKATEIPRGARTRADGERLPAVFVLPGIAGTHLALGQNPITDKSRVWVDIENLFKGRFDQLKIDSPDVHPDGLVAAYRALIEHLSASHEVIPFGYDWRKSLAETGSLLGSAVEERLLNTDLPVRIIAHSMGGLVVRAMLALCPETWQRMKARPGSRILLLGTPWQGSYSIPRLLVKQERLTRMLDLVDMHHDQDDLIGIIRKFPGVLEMLPQKDGTPLIDDSLWNACSRILGKKWSRPEKKDLAKVQEVWQLLARAELDPTRIFYVAGHASATPSKIDAADDSIHVTASDRGDGQVLWETGIPDGILHWYIKAVHGDMPEHCDAFPAYTEILQNGNTLLLPTSPPIARGDGRETELLPEEVDYLPNSEDLIGAGIGKATQHNAAPSPTLAPLRVSVVHGNLCFLRHPLVVGHYTGDTIVSAEAALNERLDHRLKRRMLAGIYPGKLMTSEVFFSDSEDMFKGAVIIGLGDLGELTAGTLTASLRDGVVKYVVSGFDRKKLTRGKIALASLLIGTGAGGISIHDSVEAILEGVLQANKQLLDLFDDPAMTISELIFNELFTDVAIQAQRTLKKLAANSRFHTHIAAENLLVVGEGGRNRPYYSEDGDWWRRLRIAGTDDGCLEFTTLSSSARAQRSAHPVSREAIDYFLHEATRTYGGKSEVGRVLFEMLVPPHLKSHAADNDRLILIVDEKSAKYPWELLEYKGHQGNEALAVKSGMIRQLASFHPPVGIKLCTEMHALVIGDPNLGEMPGFTQLAGAASEARDVAQILRKYGVANPQVLINATSAEILTRLMTREFGILHLAGHGVIDFLPDREGRKAGEDCSAPSGKSNRNQGKTRTGMVIGHNQILTSAEINQMPYTPAFVFLNCCNLGQMDEQRIGTRSQPSLLAANLATQFIQQGVKAVIAAGWEVDDTAALTFAETFYQHFLSGESFGIAVKVAREKSALLPSNTWGAYQCYGDPGFTLTKGMRFRPPVTRPHYFSLDEYRVSFDNIVSDAKVAANVHTEQLKEKMVALVQAIPPQYAGSDKLALAMGRAWAELDQLDDAITCYERALRSGTGGGTVHCAEQLAHLKARHSVTLSQAGLKTEEALQPIDQGIDLMQGLNKSFGITAERLSMLGSIHKRRAMVVRGKKAESLAELQKMFDYFYRAFNLTKQNTGQISTYPLTNWISARWLLDLAGQPVSCDEDNLGLLQSAKQSSIVSDINYEHFWKETAKNEVALLEALLNGNLAARKDEIIKVYNEISIKTSSARQLSMVAENVDFMETMLSMLGHDTKDLRSLVDRLKSLH